MESLLIGEINRARVLSQTGARQDSLKNAGGLLAEMIFLKGAGEDGVEAIDQRSVEATCGRAHQTAGACARPARPQGGASGAGPDLGSDAAYTAAWSILHNAERHAEDLSTRPGTQQVGVSNVEVVARDCDIQ